MVGVPHLGTTVSPNLLDGDLRLPRTPASCKGVEGKAGVPQDRISAPLPTSPALQDEASLAVTTFVTRGPSLKWRPT